MLSHCKTSQYSVVGTMEDWLLPSQDDGWIILMTLRIMRAMMMLLMLMVMTMILMVIVMVMVIRLIRMREFVIS